MSNIMLTIDQIVISPHNVRRNEIDATATGALEASILEHGLIEPIIVHPLEDRPGMFGAIAGGRRTRSIRNLVDRGALAADWPVNVGICGATSVFELILISLSENVLRKELRNYEVYAGVRELAEAGGSREEIAHGMGQSALWADKMLRLGTLAEPIFVALSSGQISVEQAEAFGATADQDLQTAAWAALSTGYPHARNPAAIRAWYRIEDREAEKLLRFVGVDAYRDAGGWYEQDLFDDGSDGRGRVTDDALLRRLADAKIEQLRDATRERVGRPDLRFVPQSPRGEYGGPDAMLYVSPGGPDENELPDGDVVGVITIAESGEADVGFWWASRKAMHGDKQRPAAKRDRLPTGAAIGQQFDNSRQAADAAIKEEAGLTQEGTQIVRSLRRAILRAALVQDAREGRVLGRDYLVWAQLRLQLSTAGGYGHSERAAEVGMRSLHAADPDGDPAAQQIRETEAGHAWTTAIAELKKQSFLTEPDLAAAFLDFRNASQIVRDLAAAVVAGLALERSLEADGYRVPVHDALAVQARVAHPQGIRHWWKPTAAFLELLPTAERRAIAEPFFEPAAFAGWAKLKSAELTPLVLRVVIGTAPSTKRSQQLAAAQWVHPLLSFRADAGITPAVQAEQLEVAA